MKKIILLIVAVIVVIVGGILIGRSSSNESGYVVKVANLPIMPSKLPLEIAIEKGFFKEAGVEVQTTEIASSNLLVDALVRGDVDVTPESSLVPYFTAELVDPGKLKIISASDLTSEYPFDSMIVKDDSAIQGLSDLKGKKIGVFTGSTATNMLKLFFKQKGIDSSSMQFIQLAPPQQLVALSAGSIDALFTYEPTLSIGLGDNHMRKIYGSVYAEQTNHSPIGGGLMNAKFAKDHPAEAKKIVEALDRAHDYIRTNPEEAREIAATLFKFTPEVKKSVSLPYSFTSTKIDKGIVDKFLDLLVTAGELKSKPDTSNIFYSAQ